MLPGISSAAGMMGPFGPVAITRTADTDAASFSSTLATYSSVAIGDASTDRIVVVCVTGSNADLGTLTATIDYGGGDTAMLYTDLADIGDISCRINYLPVPTGTTATIKVSIADSLFSAAMRITVYSVTKGSFLSGGTDTSTDMDSSDRLTTGSITIPEGGGFIACASCASDTVAKSWANATEDLDSDAGSFRRTTATRTTAGTVEITCTGTTDGEDGALAWAVFAPG